MAAFKHPSNYEVKKLEAIWDLCEYCFYGGSDNQPDNGQSTQPGNETPNRPDYQQWTQPGSKTQNRLDSEQRTQPGDKTLNRSDTKQNCEFGAVKKEQIRAQ